MGGLTLRPVDPVADLALVHRWMNDPEVAAHWQMADPIDETAVYLAMRGSSPHVQLRVGDYGGRPVSYWEIYRADVDALGCFYSAKPYDMGLRLLIGPPEWRGKGLAAEFIDEVARQVFAAGPETERLVADPDLRNVRAVRAFTSAGFRVGGEMTLPERRPVLLIRERGIADGHPQEPRGA